MVENKYFLELSALPLLTAEEEILFSTEIRLLEEKLWYLLFKSKTYGHETVEILRYKWDPSDYSSIVRFLKLSKYRKAARRARIADIDRELLLYIYEYITNKYKTSTTKLRSLFLEAKVVRDKFARGNLRLVVSIARKFLGHSVTLEDLIQDGNFGLLKAIHRFDHTKGFKFSTYATWWIRHAISRAIADRGREIRIPVHLIDSYYKINKITKELRNSFDRDPTREEISEASGVDLEKLDKILLAMSNTKENPREDDQEDHMLSLADIENETAEMDLFHNEQIRNLKSIIKMLKPLEADILCMRFGIDHDKEYTLGEIGEKYGFSRERIRQLQDGALEKVRKAIERSERI